MLKFLILFATLWTSSSALSITFFRENITIEISDNSYNLRGIYYFKNVSDTEISRLLYFPFMINEGQLFPDSISVYNRFEAKELNFSLAKSGIHFLLTVPAKSVVLIDIFYTQQILSPNLEYILSTTLKWDRPLDLAEFNLSIPQDFEIIYLSYPFRELAVKGKNVIFHYKEKIFSPNKNLIIRWERKKR